MNAAAEMVVVCRMGLATGELYGSFIQTKYAVVRIPALLGTCHREGKTLLTQTLQECAWQPYMVMLANPGHSPSVCQQGTTAGPNQRCWAMKNNKLWTLTEPKVNVRGTAMTGGSQTPKVTYCDSI